MIVILYNERKERLIHRGFGVQGGRAQPCISKCCLMNKVAQNKHLVDQAPCGGLVIFPLLIPRKMGLSGQSINLGDGNVEGIGWPNEKE